MGMAKLYGFQVNYRLSNSVDTWDKKELVSLISTEGLVYLDQFNYKIYC